MRVGRHMAVLAPLSEELLEQFLEDTEPARFDPEEWGARFQTTAKT